MAYIQIPGLENKATIVNNDLLLGWDSENSKTVNFRKQDLFGTSPVNTYETGSLKADYRFDEGIGTILTDSSFNALNGLLGGSNIVNVSNPTWSIQSTVGLDFKASESDFISLPTDIWFNGNFTIEALVNIKSFTSNARILDIGNGQANNNIVLATSNGTNGLPYLEIVNGTTSVGKIVSAKALKLYEWQYIQVTLTATTIAIYINLVNVANGTITSPPNNISRSSNFIGKSNWSSDSYLDGSIAMLRVYSKALSLQERINNFATTKANFLTKGISI